MRRDQFKGWLCGIVCVRGLVRGRPGFPARLRQRVAQPGFQRMQVVNVGSRLVEPEQDRRVREEGAIVRRLLGQRAQTIEFGRDRAGEKTLVQCDEFGRRLPCE